MSDIQPGMVIAIKTEIGWAAGLIVVTHRRLGVVVWVSERLFTERPVLDQVRAVTRWRWPVLLSRPKTNPLRGLDVVGEMPVPVKLENLPVFRQNVLSRGWREVVFSGRTMSVERVGRLTTDYSLPVWELDVVESLQQKIVSGYRPENVGNGPA